LLRLLLPLNSQV